MKYVIEYTDGIPVGFGGKMFSPSLVLKWIGKPCVIKIRPEYKEDVGLLNHEIKHVEQFNTYWFYNIRYDLSKAFRYKMELEAYTEQVRTYEYKYLSQCMWIVEALYGKYQLDIPKERIITDISLRCSI